MKKIYFVTDKSMTQRGEQLPDGRIISLYDENNSFYLRYDDVIDLDNGVIIRRYKHNVPELTDDEINKGYTTLNKLKSENKLKDVNCLDEVDFDRKWYNTDKDIEKKIVPNKIINYFKKRGYNVTMDALQHQIDNWLMGFKCGYRDEKNGYHLFTPCGGNPFSIRATRLNKLSEDWQTTYWC